MRVALVSPYSLSWPGGVQAQVMGLARALRAGGHEAVVIAPLDTPLGARALPPEAVVGVGRSVAVPANGSVARLTFGGLSAPRTLRALSQLAPEVSHLHEPLAPGPTWAALARRGPKVGTFHRAGTMRGGQLLAPVARRAAARLTLRTAVSEEARLTAIAMCGGRPDDYLLVGNGVELDRFTGVDPWPAEGPTVLFVGRHEPRKGLAVLLEAFGRLDRSLGARLWVAGQGPQTGELRRRFGDNPGVQWLGRIDDGELARRLAGAAVLCAPSLGGESFGVVLLEAMAARAVVVASDIPGYAAVVQSHGVLVPPGDVAALAGALGATLADVVAGKGCGTPGALGAAVVHAGRWSMTRISERYLGAYHRAIDESARAPRP